MYRSNLNLLTEDSPEENTPKQLKVELYSHQRKVLHLAKELESKSDIPDICRIPEFQLTTTYGCLTFKQGYGKTISALSIMALDRPIVKSRPDAFQNYDFTRRSEVFYMIRSPAKELPPLRGKNLVVVQKLLFNQWLEEIKNKTSYKVLALNSRTDLKREIKASGGKEINEMVLEYDIVLMSEVFMSAMNSSRDFTDSVWDRVFYDEYPMLLSKLPHINARFTWILTATPNNFLRRGRNCVMIETMNVQINCSESLLEKSYGMPHPIEKIYVRIIPGFVGSVYKYLDNNTKMLINSENLIGALQSLSTNSVDIVSNTDEIVAKFQEKLVMELTREKRRLEAEQSMGEFSNESIINRIKENITDFETKIANIKERLIEQSECPICYMDLRDVTTATTQCGHTFCINCTLKVFSKKHQCPICRGITGKTTIKSGILKKPKTEQTKKDILREILSENNSGKKFIVYIHDNPKIIDEVSDIPGLQCLTLKYYRPQDIKLYTEGGVNVLFIDYHTCAGINLNCTTDIILFNTTHEDTEKQLIGRCNRIPRTDSLKIHRIVNQFE